MKSFAELVAEAEAADVNGWVFDWLEGRASEERPPWGYSRLLRQRLAHVESALDLDTGGGEVLDEMPRFPAQMCATEAWPPNAQKARERLAARGVQVVETPGDAALPFADAAFELVTSRHPVQPNWAEIHRVLRPGGHYFCPACWPGFGLRVDRVLSRTSTGTAAPARSAQRSPSCTGRHPIVTARSRPSLLGGGQKPTRFCRSTFA